MIETKPGFVYVRKAGKYLGRIEAPYPSAEFDRQYWDVLTGRAGEASTSWRALIVSYRKSDRWTRLKPRTRQDYEKALLYIEEKNGARDMTRLQRRDVLAMMEKNTHRTRFANYVAQVMSVLCEHAIDLGWIKANPVKGVRLKKTPTEREQPHVPWTNAAVERWRAEAAPLPRLIFEIGVGSVQRPGDWPGFTWGDYDGESLRLTQGKTGKALALPCTPELRTALEAAKRELGAAPHPSRHILARKDGTAMLYRDVSRVMLKERKRLHLTGFDLHALRYRGVMELAWAGCDDDEIASFSGHSSKDMIRKYAGIARQIMRASTAAEKRKLWASL
ncbi:tyrosine-type recombinase/integrase [Histidinibacterium lentulum]|uniref:tyrosine-type recombinase/integrase n=1 Tax=Histidinibacterium lentulum TaxID=2480588 RepID=UPI001FE90780|nr:tyrosine-type recombinase/integrase [Histidinibacterium lentulum]